MYNNILFRSINGQQQKIWIIDEGSEKNEKTYGISFQKSRYWWQWVFVKRLIRASVSADSKIDRSWQSDARISRRHSRRNWLERW